MLDKEVGGRSARCHQTTVIDGHFHSGSESVSRTADPSSLSRLGMTTIKECGSTGALIPKFSASVTLTRLNGFRWWILNSWSILGKSPEGCNGLESLCAYPS